MELQDNAYDVILLGSGLGGLVAGTFLSRRNCSVLLLKESGYKSVYEHKGFRFTPFSNFSEIRLKPTLLRRVSQALSLPLPTPTQEDERQNEKQVAFQVILPKARIDLFSKSELFQAELRREFPKEVARIEDFYEEMNQVDHLLRAMEAKEGPESLFPLQSPSLIKRLLPFAFFRRGGIEERLSSFSREFRQFIQLQLISLGNLYSGRYPSPLAAHLLSNDGTDDEPGGPGSGMSLERFEETLTRDFLQSGGRIEEIERVEKVDRKRYGGFVLSAGDRGIFQTKSLVLNGPLHRLSNLLSKQGKGISRLEKRTQLRHTLVPLFLGIRGKVVPVGMKDLLVSIFDLERPYEGGNLLFLFLSPQGDEAQAPEGKRALTVESVLSSGNWDSDSRLNHQKGVMEHLNWLFPFLENQIVFCDWSWTDEQFSRWSYPHFLYEITSGFHWREGVVPTRISHNLYFIGKENFPYLGLEGEVLSGLMTGRQVLRKLSC